ncbi:MAG: hypothetical protein AB1798_20450 [Spirochaetota bacterium]
MSANYTREPTVIIPYPGPCSDGECQDVFVVLRPEANGVMVESTLLKVVNNHPDYKNNIRFIYLANIPGDFIVKNRIVEHHYIDKLYFCTKEKRAFTPGMKKKFEDYFHLSFEQAYVIGAFTAMKELGMSYNELFNLRVSSCDMVEINGQNVKKYGKTFIINYDIPAILHKNNNRTDIAVMIFRTQLNYPSIHQLIGEMGRALIEADILDPEKPLSRIFHYSKGPFGQIRDAIGYLYNDKNEHLPLQAMTFSNFLIKKGISVKQIMGIINNPIMQFITPNGDIIEENLFVYTKDDTFASSHAKLTGALCQFILR